MNELLKKIVYACFAVYFIESILCGAILQSRLERYRDQCEQYRVQLEAAANRERDIENTIQRTGLILCESINSVGELREQLKEVRECYEEMENILYGSEWSSPDGITSNNSDEVIDVN